MVALGLFLSLFIYGVFPLYALKTWINQFKHRSVHRENDFEHRSQTIDEECFPCLIVLRKEQFQMRSDEKFFSFLIIRKDVLEYNQENQLIELGRTGLALHDQ